MTKFLAALPAVVAALPFLATMTGIGVLTGIFIALACMAITIVAANPWLPIVFFAAIYAAIGITIEVGKL